MKCLKKALLVLALLLPIVTFGQAKVGTAGLQFLKVGICARAVGMASFTAVSDDASALYYNPAGLVQLLNPEATFSYISYPAEINYVHLGGVYPLTVLRTRSSVKTASVIGVQVTSMFTDEMDETTPEMPYGTGRTFTASDLALGITYSQRLTGNFSVGVTLKFLNEELADQGAYGWSADVGTYYTTGWRKINIGMVIQNFGPDMEFESSPFPLPMNFKFGMSIVALEQGPYKLLLAGEFVHPNDNLEEYILGGELTVMNMISFRFGKRINAWQRATWEEYQEDREQDPFVEYPVLDEEGKPTLDGLSLGMGLKIPQAGVNLDYAWAGLGTLGFVHRFTLSYKLNGLFQ